MASQRHGGHEEGSGDEGDEEGGHEGCHEEGEEGGQRDEEGSHEGPSHEEGHEEGQGDRGGMRAEEWGGFQMISAHSMACCCGYLLQGWASFSRRGLFVWPLKPACVYIVWFGLVSPPRRKAPGCQQRRCCEHLG